MAEEEGVQIVCMIGVVAEQFWLPGRASETAWARYSVHLVQAQGAVAWAPTWLGERNSLGGWALSGAVLLLLVAASGLSLPLVVLCTPNDRHHHVAPSPLPCGTIAITMWHHSHPAWLIRQPSGQDCWALPGCMVLPG